MSPAETDSHHLPGSPAAFQLPTTDPQPLGVSLVDTVASLVSAAVGGGVGHTLEGIAATRDYYDYAAGVVRMTHWTLSTATIAIDVRPAKGRGG